MNLDPHRPVLEIRSLEVAFANRHHGYLTAIRGFDLNLGRGEVLGLVGESGSGKTVTCLAAMRLLPPRTRVRGRILFRGEDLLAMDRARLDRIRGGQLAMISQDPMSALNPVHTVGWQIRESLLLHRSLTGAAARKESLRLLDSVGIAAARQRLRDYPHQLSGGMCQRVMIAMALAGRPSVLIADEPTTALDVTIQAQILDLVNGLVRESGGSMILITHDLGVVAENCDRMVVLYGGRVAETGPVEKVFKNPRHPYTQGLLASLPGLDRVEERLTPIKGTVPSLADLPPGCAFTTRCDRALNHCRRVQPELVQVDGPGHQAACHLLEGSAPPGRAGFRPSGGPDPSPPGAVL